MKRLLVIGDPVEHSLSPIMHNAALAHLGLQDEYKFERQKVAASELEWFMGSLPGSGIAGLSVTMPHKVAVIQHLDIMAEDAKLAGAVNTVIVRNGRLEGHNTDGIGCVRALEEAGVSIRGRDVAILGAGGAARAAAFCLAKSAPHIITILNRTESKAAELAGAVERNSGVRASGHGLEYLANAKPDILINATPAGFRPPDGLMREEMAVLDMAYGPGETTLIAMARKAGATAIPGTEMLLHQGTAQFRLFTGMEAPVDIMRKAIGGRA